MDSGDVLASDIPATRAISLGPMVELHHFQRSIKPSHDSSTSWLSADEYSELQKNLGNTRVWHKPDTGRQGYITMGELRRDGLAWTDFAMRSKRAALSAGFSDDDSGKLIGAIGEFYSNVTEHSERTETGYIVFAASPGRFEFVVADAGIGVLNSLRSNPKYAKLDDAGSALELALSEGVSRYQGESGHGFGFRPVFLGLANMSRFLRFRSADHSRELKRLTDGDIEARTIQKSHLNGFFCSVLCEV
jgi:anti-sigma regulatory factor (Ser/Thr protein kinase)